MPSYLMIGCPKKKPVHINAGKMFMFAHNQLFERSANGSTIITRINL